MEPRRSPISQSPEDLRRDILAFLGSLARPALREDGMVLRLAKIDGAPASVAASSGGPAAARTELDTARSAPDAASDNAQWRLGVEFGKLVLEVWSETRSFARRVESVECDGARMTIRARKAGAQGSVTLELFEFDGGDGAPVRQGGDSVQTSSGLAFEEGSIPDPARRERERAGFESDLLAALSREFPRFHFERVSHAPDREHTFSGCFTRGWAWRPGEAWAFLGLSPSEGVWAAENALAYGLIWLDWLRERPDSGSVRRPPVTRLKLVLPPAAVALAAHRAAHLDPRAIELYEWIPGGEAPRPIDLHDYGNVETSLTRRTRGEVLLSQCRPALQLLMGDGADRIAMVPDASAEALSLRVFGLEVARFEGAVSPRLWIGVEGEYRPIEDVGEAAARAMFKSVLRLRRARSPDRSHPFYRLQPERWLESLLVEDITKIDPALLPEHVYPQVPALAGSSGAGITRGVIDILGVRRDPESGAHSLAVVELKLDEDPNLPLQGLDYWLRVKWLEARGQFQQFGYFPDFVAAAAPPVLYLVCPAFRFHSTTERVLRYFQPTIRVVKVGVNERWREDVHVLFRRTLVQGRRIEDC